MNWEITKRPLMEWVILVCEQMRMRTGMYVYFSPEEDGEKLVIEVDPQTRRSKVFYFTFSREELEAIDDPLFHILRRMNNSMLDYDPVTDAGRWMMDREMSRFNGMTLEDTLIELRKCDDLFKVGAYYLDNFMTVFSDWRETEKGDGTFEERVDKWYESLILPGNATKFLEYQRDKERYELKIQNEARDFTWVHLYDDEPEDVWKYIITYRTEAEQICTIP